MTDQEFEELWNTLIYQAAIRGYISKGVEDYGGLKLTEKGKDFLKHSLPFKIMENCGYDTDDEEMTVHMAGSQAVDPVLYAMLKDLRQILAKRHKRPPYVIFRGSSLKTMAAKRPITIEELLHIPGMEQNRVKRYGKVFCELIKYHCEEKEREQSENQDEDFLRHPYPKRHYEENKIERPRNLTNKREEFLKRNANEDRPVRMPDAPTTTTPPTRTRMPAQPITLYDKLKDLRKTLAERLHQSPYAIFSNASLKAMADRYPVTIEEFQDIPGVGRGKAMRYGGVFCELIRRHCQENGIE